MEDRGSGKDIRTISSGIPCGGSWDERMASPPGGPKNSGNFCLTIARKLGSRRGFSKRYESVGTTFLFVMSENACLKKQFSRGPLPQENNTTYFVTTSSQTLVNTHQ